MHFGSSLIIPTVILIFYKNSENEFCEKKGQNLKDLKMSSNPWVPKKNIWVKVGPGIFWLDENGECQLKSW